MPFGLAIHTSSPELGLAIGAVASPAAGSSPTAELLAKPLSSQSFLTSQPNPDQLPAPLSPDQPIRWQTWNLGREVSGQLQQIVLDFLLPQAWQDLAFIAVAKGPGGFTGTRLGVVMARTLAQQLNLPLFGYSSLAAIAQATLQDPEQRGNLPLSTSLIAVQMPAQRGELHTALYQIDAAQSDSLGGRSIDPTAVLPDSVLSETAWQTKLAQLNHPYFVIETPSQQGFAVSALWQLARQAWLQGDRPHWANTLPTYGQHPVN
ncbi:MAG: tRNA (adenosine(37)-N6)-threonylcarbamoyltransferase complex dimerization subunit type 1 TsaB [Synechococcales bacterium]|nr:tRNA (adenosine(37)-N6)-threonylcarbamoyltransferase complex dimerization subunit type 1 TsaB [Synechococcales bacterium]